MKVILLKDVPRIGRKLEVKEVPDGHALNYLLPRKLAERATPTAIARLEAEQKNVEAVNASAREGLKKIASALRETPPSITVDANEQGGLFRAVHASDVALALKALGHSFPEENILIDTPIKALGNHQITLSVGGLEENVAIVVTRK